MYTNKKNKKMFLAAE